jgi:hypothetical protein
VNRRPDPPSPVPPALVGALAEAAPHPRATPFDPATDRARRPSAAAPASAAARAPAGPSPSAAAHDEVPLPSKEETLRDIEAEAAQKQAELRVQHQAKQAEYRRLRDEERQKFRDELRDILESGGRAGPAIDALCLRYGYETAPETFARASRAWAASSRSWDAKIRVVRALDLAEPMILNFISDDLHGRLRARNGLRDSNEVRVRAAQLLLSCELPPPGSADRPAAAAATGGRSPGRVSATPSARVTAVPPR